MSCMISVIVPVYQVEKYLRRCVDSILNQTFEDYEVILVDDGSKDSSGKICDEYSALDTRIKVIHQENRGLSGARNTGIAAAKGEWIIFVDSDDYIAENMLNDLYKAVTDNNVLMAICNFQCIDDAGNDTGESNGSPIQNVCVDAKSLLERIYEKGGWFYVVAWNKIYHRSLLSDEFYPLNKLHEDEFVIAEVIWKAQMIACIECKNYFYVTRREGSITHAKNNFLFIDSIEALVRRFHLYKNIGLGNLAIQTRRIAFKKLEMYCTGSDIERSILQEGKKLYKRMLGISFKERIRWILFNIKYWKKGKV